MIVGVAGSGDHSVVKNGKVVGEGTGIRECLGLGSLEASYKSIAVQAYPSEQGSGRFGSAVFVRVWREKEVLIARVSKSATFMKGDNGFSEFSVEAALVLLLRCSMVIRISLYP